VRENRTHGSEGGGNRPVPPTSITCRGATVLPLALEPIATLPVASRCSGLKARFALNTKVQSITLPFSGTIRGICFLTTAIKKAICDETDHESQEPNLAI